MGGCVGERDGRGWEGRWVEGWHRVGGAQGGGTAEGGRDSEERETADGRVGRGGTWLRHHQALIRGR